ncbi:HAD family hydrolase [Ferrovibrio sp.]|uniref:KdsC family phosphatase n=1 Tax=Ferrovibrio sp. TaxID=1917215 RepID=UPI000CB5F26D|nr:HAD hydrolase family protein [Ferrovibrio sp.]PJI41907.1 MAG: 3-deoxy-D-manno-octulosonate 8-phosphate phosphatase [Ferrovibrio sp.]
MLRTDGLDAGLTAAIRTIRLIVFDFDGVFTDNTVIVSEDGRESVVCWRSDGLGLAKLRQRGLEMRVLSTEVNPVVAVRCRKLQLDCQQGCDDKLTALKRLAEARGLSAGQVAYMGNDINDSECLRWAGLPVVPDDAHPDVLALARLRTSQPGGRGAVREFCDLVDGVLA